VKTYGSAIEGQTLTRPEQFRSGNFHPMRFKHLPSFHFNDAGAIPLRKFSSNAFQASSVISLQRGRSNSVPEIFIQCVSNIFRHFTSTMPEQFRSGNFHPMRSKHLPSFHFNVAGAIQLRKSSHTKRSSRSSGRASMRPEQFSSGNPLCPLCLCGGISLLQ